MASQHLSSRSARSIRRLFWFISVGSGVPLSYIRVENRTERRSPHQITPSVYSIEYRLTTLPREGESPTRRDPCRLFAVPRRSRLLSLHPIGTDKLCSRTPHLLFIEGRTFRVCGISPLRPYLCERALNPVGESLCLLIRQRPLRVDLDARNLDNVFQRIR